MIASTLSDTQVQILLNRGAGFTVEEAAGKLGLTTNQYWWQHRQLLDALGARETAHALAIAIVRGIITIQDLRRGGCY